LDGPQTEDSAQSARAKLFARNAVGPVLDLEVPKMNRAQTVMRLNADRGRGDDGLASAPSATPGATPSSWLGPGDLGILAAFAASVSACIAIWGWALGYL
jgi:hypothetical protein